jgi:hypothetical protein
MINILNFTAKHVQNSIQTCHTQTLEPTHQVKVLNSEQIRIKDDQSFDLYSKTR